MPDTEALETIQGLETKAPSVARTVDLAFCVCAMDRNNVLRRCLQSIAESNPMPAEVIVSDDSRQPAETEALCAEYAFVRYVRGPQRGLCANRNSAIRASTCAYLSFLDDDAVLAPDFVARAAELMENADPRAIFTGDLWEGDPPRLLPPGNPTFWGHFAPARDGTRLRTIHINCNLIPRTAFAHAAFDENLFYGYDEIDVCAQFLAEGFRIEHCPALQNAHIPPPKARPDRARELRLAEEARFYTTIKRCLLLERNLPKTAAYVLLAPLHRIAHAVKTRQWADIAGTLRDMRTSLRRVAVLRQAAALRRPPA